MLQSWSLSIGPEARSTYLSYQQQLLTEEIRTETNRKTTPTNGQCRVSDWEILAVPSMLGRSFDVSSDTVGHPSSILCSVLEAVPRRRLSLHIFHVRDKTHPAWAARLSFESSGTTLLLLLLLLRRTPKTPNPSFAPTHLPHEPRASVLDQIPSQFGHRPRISPFHGPITCPPRLLLVAVRTPRGNPRNHNSPDEPSV